MEILFDWIKKHKLLTAIITICAFLGPILIVHILFSFEAPSFWVAAKWEPGELLTYIAGFESLLGTIVLGAVTVYQSIKANEVNERLARENNYLQKIGIQPLLPILTVSKLDVKNAEYCRFTVSKEESCSLYVSAAVTREEYKPHINVYMPHNTIPSQQYCKTVNLSLGNISDGPIAQIAVDRIVFSGFQYQKQSIDKTVCSGLAGHNTISWMILPKEGIDLCIDIYYDNDVFTKFWEFNDVNSIGSFDMCLFLTNKSVSGITYRERIYINKYTNLKEHIMYKAYEEEHPNE